MRTIYLHGFASGPASKKASFFRDRTHTLEIPALAAGDFEHLTITGQLNVIEELAAGEPVSLIGSSLGGYLAALAAARQADRVRGLVLFAPAFGFAQRWEARIGPAALARWRAEGTAPVHHYARGRELPLAIDLLDDARRYPAEPDPAAPALVLAGRHDEAVPLAAVERFARARPGRELVVYDSGHELTDVLEPMWERTLAFLRRVGAL